MFLALAAIVGLGSLVLAIMDPSMVGSWLTVLAMACVAAAQVSYLRKTPPEHN